MIFPAYSNLSHRAVSWHGKEAESDWSSCVYLKELIGALQVEPYRNKLKIIFYIGAINTWK